MYKSIVFGDEFLCSRDTYESKYSMFLNTQSCASVIGAHRGGGGSSGLSRAVRGGAVHGVSSNQIRSWAADDLASWQPHGQSAVPVAVVGHTVSAHLSRAALRIEVVPAAVLVVQLRFGVWIRPSADRTRVLEIRFFTQMSSDIFKWYQRTRFL